MISNRLKLFCAELLVLAMIGFDMYGEYVQTYAIETLINHNWFIISTVFMWIFIIISVLVFIGSSLIDESDEDLTKSVTQFVYTYGDKPFNMYPIGILYTLMIIVSIQVGNFLCTAASFFVLVALLSMASYYKNGMKQVHLNNLKKEATEEKELT